MSETGENEVVDREQEEALVKAGFDAETLLSDPTFTGVVNQVIEHTFSVFTGTTSDEADKRESAFMAYRGIADIVDTLRQRVGIKNQILESRPDTDDNNQEEQ